MQQIVNIWSAMDIRRRMIVVVATLAMFGAVLIIWIFFQVASGGIFLSPRNLWNLSVQTSVTAMLATGMVVMAQTTPPADSGINFWQVLSGLLLVASMFFVGQLSKVRAKVADVMVLLREAIELVTYILKASEDNTFTPDEQARIKQEALDVKVAWFKLLGKTV